VCQITVKWIAAVHARLKLELGRYMRAVNRWDELVRDVTMLENVLAKVGVLQSTRARTI
jgi:hypothetical protein